MCTSLMTLSAPPSSHATVYLINNSSAAASKTYRVSTISPRQHVRKTNELVTARSTSRVHSHDLGCEPLISPFALDFIADMKPGFGHIVSWNRVPLLMSVNRTKSRGVRAMLRVARSLIATRRCCDSRACKNILRHGSRVRKRLRS